MVRGFYTSASGMQSEQHRMNAIANNLANVDLTGYKRDVSVHKAFPELLLRRLQDDGIRHYPFGSMDNAPVVGKLGLGVEYNESYTVFEQGALKETASPFDLALDASKVTAEGPNGDTFFVVDTPYGERYTRNGSFTLGKEGMLVTKEGYPVLGENGPLFLKLNNFTVDSEGSVFHNPRYSEDPYRLVSQTENEWEESELVDRLAIVDFDKVRFLRKEGGSLWSSTDLSGGARMAEGEKRPTVRQGFIEASNVNPVNEMVNMIEVNRAYEANQKVIQAHDSLVDRLINQTFRL